MPRKMPCAKEKGMRSSRAAKLSCFPRQLSWPAQTDKPGGGRGRYSDSGALFSDLILLNHFQSNTLGRTSKRTRRLPDEKRTQLVHSPLESTSCVLFSRSISCDRGPLGWRYSAAASPPSGRQMARRRRKNSRSARVVVKRRASRQALGGGSQRFGAARSVPACGRCLWRRRRLRRHGSTPRLPHPSRAGRQTAVVPALDATTGRSAENADVPGRQSPCRPRLPRRTL